MKTRTRFVTVCLLLVVGLLAGCSSEVKIGAIVSRTGGTSPYGQSVAKGLDLAVEETVAALASQSPAALALGKAAFYAVADMDLDTALDHLHIGLTAVASTEDAQEGVKAFLEKRDPRWRGH